MKPQSIFRSRGRYKKSAETRTSIIRGAIDLLINEGYHNFSLRKVAVRAGVSIGNLQHHFSTKETLISVMLDDVISGYLDEFSSVIRTTDSPREQLRSVIQRVMEDITTKETTMFFPELWSLANHEPAVSALMYTMYHKYQQIYHEIIRKINPKLSENQIEKVGLFFVASLEGHTIFVGHGKNATQHSDCMAEIAYSSFLNIIESGSIPD